jgi:hypothetical protein
MLKVFDWKCSIEFLCCKWKPYPRVVFYVEIGLSIVLYMRSLLLVESFDLRPSNQYILERVIPSCFRFVKMCLCQVSLLSRCSPRYLTSSRGSCTFFIWDRGGNASLRVVNAVHKMMMKTVTGYFVCGVDSPLNVIVLNQLFTAK